MDAKKVFHHDDPPCNARLVDRYCPECKFHPDIQSLCIYYYCPSCDVPLVNLKCDKCQHSFEIPRSVREMLKARARKNPFKRGRKR